MDEGMDGWMWWRVVWVDAVAADILSQGLHDWTKTVLDLANLATNQKTRLVRANREFPAFAIVDHVIRMNSKRARIKECRCSDLRRTRGTESMFREQ